MFRVPFLTIFAVLSNYACARPFEEVTRPLEMTHHCCLSKLSTLTLVDVSVEAYSEEVAQAEVFMDYDKGMQAIKYSHVNKHTGNITFISRVVLNYKQGRSYEIRNPTERVTQCYNRSLPLVAPPRCIPEFATLITRGYKISTWRVVQHPFDLTYSFTSDTCEPVNIRQKGEQDIIAVDMDVMVSNYTRSVDDMDVFLYPSDCIVTRQPLRLPFPWKDLSQSSSAQTESSVLSTISSRQKTDAEEKVQLLAPPLLGSKTRAMRLPMN
ncbi:hypothetical protein C0Q70_04796 [Pomacea canaliculata]|uniref:Uncharacterized protein n=2 Tax=Pomacea canaliculata TaxID=400727 RepID=A0A2T7PJD8_POMCA|nr:hypothetical protein C0Q70_04796 [Pomacea canaliculata]